MGSDKERKAMKERRIEKLVYDVICSNAKSNEQKGMIKSKNEQPLSLSLSDTESQIALAHNHWYIKYSLDPIQ